MFSSILLSVLITVAITVCVAQVMGTSAFRLTFLILGTPLVFLLVHSMVVPSTSITEEGIISLVFGVPISIIFSLLGHTVLQRIKQ